MKKLILFAVVVFSTSTVFAQPKLTRVLHQFKSIHTGWQSANEDTFAYDNKGLLKTVGFNTFFLTTKTHSYIDSNYYNSSGQLDSTKGFRWSIDSNTWKLSYERLIKYEYNGARLRKIIKLNDGINSKFEDIDSFIYNTSGLVEYHYRYSKERATGLKLHLTRLKSKYTTLGKIDEQIRQYPTGGVWTSTIRVSYKYNSSDSLVEKLQEGFQGGVWTNGLRTTYTYNNNGELIEEFHERYNTSKSSWEGGDKFENIYVSGKKAYTVKHLYIGSTWVAVDTSKFIYNPDGTLKMYYPPHQGTEIRSLYFYKTLNTGLNQVEATNSIKIYPNPTSGKFTVKLEDNTLSTISITDVTGKQVFTSKVSDNLDVDVSHLAKGFYFVNVRNTNGVTTQKIVIQ